MLERFEILDKLALVFVTQPQSEMFVVMFDHILQCLEATRSKYADSHRPVAR